MNVHLPGRGQEIDSTLVVRKEIRPPNVCSSVWTPIQVVWPVFIDYLAIDIRQGVWRPFILMFVTVVFIRFHFRHIFGIIILLLLSVYGSKVSSAGRNSSCLAVIVAITFDFEPGFVDRMQPRFFCIRRIVFIILVVIWGSFASPPTAVSSRGGWEANLHVHGWMVSIIQFCNGG